MYFIYRPILSMKYFFDFWKQRVNLHPLRDVAQPGSARRSGRRGRRFESCHPDLTGQMRFTFVCPVFILGKSLSSAYNFHVGRKSNCVCDTFDGQVPCNFYMLTID